jgi:hypothetical protein
MEKKYYESIMKTESKEEFKYRMKSEGILENAWIQDIVNDFDELTEVQRYHMLYAFREYRHLDGFNDRNSRNAKRFEHFHIAEKRRSAKKNTFNLKMKKEIREERILFYMKNISYKILIVSSYVVVFTIGRIW